MAFLVSFLIQKMGMGVVDNEKLSCIESTVISCDGEYAYVAGAQSGCGRCHEADGCGGNITSRLFCHTPRSFKVVNRIDARPGDHVIIAVDRGVVTISALVLYIFPLSMFLFGTFSGVYWFPASDLGPVIGSVLGLSIALLLIISWNKKKSRNRDFHPYILSRVPQKGS